MSDLRSRFRAVESVQAPDLWDEIREREPGPLSDGGPSRVATIVVALVISIVGVGTTIVALGDLDEHGAAGTSVANGRIAFVAFDGDNWQLYSCEPDGSDVTQLTHVNGDLGVSGPTWSPDGHRIAYAIRGDSSAEPANIWVMNANGTNQHPITSGAGSSWGPAWSPDGSRIAYVNGHDVYVMSADGSGRESVTGSHHGEGLPANYFEPVWSPDGSELAIVGRDGDDDLYVVRSDGSAIRTLFSGTGYQRELAWSPDGSTIAFADVSEESGSDVGSFYLIDPEGRSVGRLTRLPPNAQAPSWSPDGRSILFMANVEGTEREAIYVMDADGSGVRELPGLPENAIWPSWQPVFAGAESAAPTPPPTSSARPVASVEPHVTTIRDIASYPGTVVAGDGGAWVSAPRADGSGGGDLVHIDVASGEIVGRIPVRALPGWEFGGGGATIADGRVWLLGTVEHESCCQALATSIDQATDTVLDEFEVPGEPQLADDVWVDGEALYALSSAMDGRSMIITRVDVSTHERSWSTSVPAHWAATVFVTSDSVWVLGTAPDAGGPVEPNTLYRLDPATGTELDVVSVPTTSVWAPVFDGKLLWWRGEAGDGIQRLDPTTGQMIGDPIDPAPGCCQGEFVGDGEGGVWVTSSSGAGIDRSIWHIDASGKVVASGTFASREDFEAAGGQSYAFDPVAQTLWVQHYRDSVSRIELALAPAG